MIKSIPGWLNFFILWGGYMIVGLGLNLMVNYLLQERRIRWGERPLRKTSLGYAHISEERKRWWELIDWIYVILITGIYCGGYLAKWRFYDEGWHFW